KIAESQREREPAAAEGDAAAAGAGLKVVAEEPAEVGLELGIEDAVQAVAAVIDAHARDLEAAGHAAHRVTAFEHCHRPPLFGEVASRHQSCGPSTEHRDVDGLRCRCHAVATGAPTP